MILHRTLLILMIALYVASLFVEGGWHVAIGLALLASYVYLTIVATQLVDELGIEFTPIPLWALYIFSPLGPFISIWLDRKAREALDNSGGRVGFTRLTRP